jgi:biopolymer transport protein ExbD
MKLNRTKRRSLLRANSLEAPAGFQIAPFIDVIFVMLLFYMVKFASVQREGSRDILLPGDNDTPLIQGQEITEETIEIGSDRAIYHNGEPIADADLQSRFARLLRQTLDQGGAMVRHRWRPGSTAWAF